MEPEVFNFLSDRTGIINCKQARVISAILQLDLAAKINFRFGYIREIFLFLASPPTSLFDDGFRLFSLLDPSRITKHSCT